MIVIDVQSQRGGGGRSSSRGKSRRSYGGVSSSKRSEEGILFQFLFWLVLYSVVFITISIQEWYRNKKCRKQYEAERKKRTVQTSLECKLGQEQKMQKIKWFENKQWIVHFTSKNDSNNGSFRILDKKLVKMSPSVYKFTAKAEDEQSDLGQSQLKGFLRFKTNNISISFEKIYHDKIKSGQSIKQNKLIYEGIQSGQQFYGKWYHQNFKQNDQYSGRMRISQY